jgi:hypothetical protein
MNDLRFSHDKNMSVKISGLNKKYFPKDYAEQTKNASYEEAKKHTSINRDIHTPSSSQK